MDDRLIEMFRAADLYYRHGETMDAVARKLGTSRSTVSRLLQGAREAGLVRITLVEPTVASAAGRTLADAFGIDVVVVPVPEAVADVERLRRVAGQAARILGDLTAGRPGQVIGFAWGTTVAALVRQLDPVPTADATVVQMNGAANALTSGIPYAGMILTDAGRALGERVVQFPVPAFFDRQATREAMWQERSIRRVLDLRRQLDCAVFGVGAIGARVGSHVYTAGYLDRDDLARLHADGVVGDVSTVMLRADGSWRDIPLNARASGMTPEELAGVPHRLCVVASPSKAAALLGALQAGVATRLVVDETTARRCARLLRDGAEGAGISRRPR